MEMAPSEGFCQGKKSCQMRCLWATLPFVAVIWHDGGQALFTEYCFNAVIYHNCCAISDGRKNPNNDDNLILTYLQVFHSNETPLS